eukprot:337182-Pyramimonas_sp.AAC.1
MDDSDVDPFLDIDGPSPALSGHSSISVLYGELPTCATPTVPATAGFPSALSSLSSSTGCGPPAKAAPRH